VCKSTTISLQAPPRILPFEMRNFDFRLWVSSMWVIRNSRPKLKGVAVYFEQLHEGPPAIPMESVYTAREFCSDNPAVFKIFKNFVQIVELKVNVHSSESSAVTHWSQTPDRQCPEVRWAANVRAVHSRRQHRQPTQPTHPCFHYIIVIYI